MQGSSASPLKGTRPRLSAAAMARAIQVFPVPTSAESMAKAPEASLSCQSHSTGRCCTSVRQRMSARRTVAEGSVCNDDCAGGRDWLSIFAGAAAFLRPFLMGGGAVSGGGSGGTGGSSAADGEGGSWLAGGCAAAATSSGCGLKGGWKSL